MDDPTQQPRASEKSIAPRGRKPKRASVPVDPTSTGITRTSEADLAETESGGKKRTPSEKEILDARLLPAHSMTHIRRENQIAENNEPIDGREKLMQTCHD